jgi:hypothetical protein
LAPCSCRGAESTFQPTSCTDDIEISEFNAMARQGLAFGNQIIPGDVLTGFIHLAAA